MKEEVLVNPLVGEFIKRSGVSFSEKKVVETASGDNRDYFWVESSPKMQSRVERAVARLFGKEAPQSRVVITPIGKVFEVKTYGKCSDLDRYGSLEVGKGIYDVSNNTKWDASWPVLQIQDVNGRVEDKVVLVYKGDLQNNLEYKRMTNYVSSFVGNK